MSNTSDDHKKSSFSREKPPINDNLGPFEAIGWADVSGVQVASVIRQRLGREVEAAQQESLYRDTSPAPVPPKTADLKALAAEVEVAHAAHRDVGQINPRPPGLHNTALQFVKKILRRSLSWYTRPIHLFQISVVRCLQLALAALEADGENLQTAVSRLSAQETTLQRNVDDYRQLAAVLARQDTVLRQNADDYRQLAAVLARQDTVLRQNADDYRQLTAVLAEQDAVLRQNADDYRQLAAVLARQDTALRENADHYRQLVAALRGEVGELRKAMLGLQEESARLRDQLAKGEIELENFRLRSRSRDRELRMFRYAVGESVLGPAPSETTGPLSTSPMFPSSLRRDGGFDYAGFEDLFRGDEDLIRARQREYLGYFRGRQRVVDVGCGRGEFLELLRDQNIDASGVELNTDQFLLCAEKGLRVVKEDLFAFLESVPDGSLGGIFSAQVIEHLTASDQFRLVKLAYEKVSAGSPVIFETINAQCVFAVVRNFFLDPTHIRPVHPETLKFTMESLKYRNVTLHYSSLPEGRIPALTAETNSGNLAEFNQAIAGLNDLIYGFQDYAAIGWR